MEEVKEGMDQEELDAQLQTILLRAFAKGRCGIKRELFQIWGKSQYDLHKETRHGCGPLP